MVRPSQLGRSRGCQPCRKRRIKCDLGQPHCQRCLESGRVCPGPLTETIFIQSEATKNGKLKGRVLPQRNASSSSSSTPPPSTGLLTVAIDPGPASLQSLLALFISFLAHSARRSSWLFCLPSLQAAPGALALRASVTAASLAHFAHKTGNFPFRVEAYYKYGNSLQLQQTALTSILSSTAAPIQSGSSGIQKPINALLATVVFSYYELLNSTHSAAWVEHTVASEMLLKLFDPATISKNNCLGKLFFSIRCHAVLRAVAYGHPTMFAETPWLELATAMITKQTVSRINYDWIVEYILRLTALIRPHPIETEDLDQDDSSQFNPQDLYKELQEHYIIFLQKQNIQDPGLITELAILPATPSFYPSIPSATTTLLHPSLRRLPQFRIMTYAFFHTAALILQSEFPLSQTASTKPSQGAGAGAGSDLLTTSTTTTPSASTPKPPRPLLPRPPTTNPQQLLSLTPTFLTTNTNAILSTANHLSVSPQTNATGLLRMAVPFAAIARYCTDIELRERAMMMFGGWCAREGMGGLGGVVVGRGGAGEGGSGEVEGVP